MTNRLKILLSFFLYAHLMAAQTLSDRYSAYGQIYSFSLQNAAFPHPKRAEGHIYQGKKYPAATHYSDSTVWVFVPKGFRWSPKVDIIVHFHGWFNHLDSVLSSFELIEQFAAANRNALLLLPQGPKDAPDSFGGQLEEAEGFKKFMAEILGYLGTQMATKYKIKPHHIILSGHSGAYRVMAHILLHGGLPNSVKEVWLFDGYYGQFEKFAVWLQKQPARFINFYTRDGGTLANSKDLDICLQAWKNAFWKGDETDLTDDILAKQPILNVFTKLEHNEVLHKTQMFQRLLTTSPSLRLKL
jgi:hypothetical protein